MDFVSIFNDVLAPVMRGPSSSHTAGAHRIALMARDLLGAAPTAARFLFDPAGSYAPTYLPLGADLAFAAGVLGWSLLDDRYPEALDRAGDQGITIEFAVGAIEESKHPNAVRVEMESGSERRLHAVAEAVGGGAIRFVRLAEWSVALDGKTHDVIVATDTEGEAQITALLGDDEQLVSPSGRQQHGRSVLLHAQRTASLSPGVRARIEEVAGVETMWSATPVYHVRQGEALFETAAEMVSIAEGREQTLGAVALAYESQLLGWTEAEAIGEMEARYDVMERSVQSGLDDNRADMLLLAPTASDIFQADAQGRTAIGGIHTRAAARSMAVMHVCNSRGVVCAAPTGGSAGVVPGVVVSLVEEKQLSRDEAVMALFAASAVGLIVARRATFAAEIAGCQVEIGVAGAMAAAAVVEAAGGSARQAVEAAAIALQNTMGSVCDPVAGACEIPCHTRNAVAASSAFTCADLIMGGYANPIPLDETIDASYAVGKALPRELRCTAAGGIAIAPSARLLPRLR